MPSSEDQLAVARSTQTMKVIIFALIAGPLCFLIFVITQTAPEADPTSLALPAAGFAAVQAVLAILLPQFIAAKHRTALAAGIPMASFGKPASSDAAGLLESFHVRRIFGAAMLEGAAFFNILAYQFERRWYSLAIVIGLLMGIAMMFPLRSYVEQWLERELRTVRELRELGG